MDHGIGLIIKIIIHIVIQYRRMIRLIVLPRDRDPAYSMATGETGVCRLVRNLDGEGEGVATFLMKLGFYNKRNLRLTVFDSRPGLISAVPSCRGMDEYSIIIYYI